MSRFLIFQYFKSPRVYGVYGWHSWKLELARPSSWPCSMTQRSWADQPQPRRRRWNDRSPKTATSWTSWLYHTIPCLKVLVQVCSGTIVNSIFEGAQISSDHADHSAKLSIPDHNENLSRCTSRERESMEWNTMKVPKLNINIRTFQSDTNPLVTYTNRHQHGACSFRVYEFLLDRMLFF